MSGWRVLVENCVCTKARLLFSSANSSREFGTFEKSEQLSRTVMPLMHIHASSLDELQVTLKPASQWQLATRQHESAGDQRVMGQRPKSG
jgi:hypothetical protein